MPSTLPRRALLRLAGGAVGAVGTAVLLPGCDLVGGGEDEPVERDPDDVLRDAAAADEVALLARYDAVLARHPGLAGRLRSLRTNHAEHLATLVAPVPSPSASPSGAAVPADPRAALRDLLALERTASAARTTWARTAGEPALVSLLGSMAACEATHAVVLAQP